MACSCPVQASEDGFPAGLLTFSPDGRSLFAGTSKHGDGPHAVRVWQAGL
jgi:hypothetical protein